MSTKRVYPMSKFKPEKEEAYALGAKILHEKSDAETGEILDTLKDREQKTPKTPDFGMVFTQDLGYLKNLQGGDAKLLFGLFGVVDRNNELTLNKARKDSLANKIGLSTKTINSSINRLKNHEILVHVDRGIYKLNPYIFGKGQWKNIHEFRMELVYDFDKEVKTERYTTVYHEEDEDEQLPYIENNKKGINSKKTENAIIIEEQEQVTSEQEPQSLDELFNMRSFTSFDDDMNNATQNSEIRDLAYADIGTEEYDEAGFKI